MDEDEDTITMLDVIEREDKLEDEASAVLGSSDEKNCTYPKGYIPRQALYSCATCSDGDDNQAAICLACSLECHENHDLYELYTKRNYRCDCGNEKFKPYFECKLIDKQIQKDPQNEKNKYNHNFSGRYCICDKRFPPDDHDDSAESSDEMWQCIVCEDWYHTKHLDARELPTKFDELICGQCAESLEFLYYYKDIDKRDPTELTQGSSECLLEQLKKESTVESDAESKPKDDSEPVEVKSEVEDESKPVEVKSDVEKQEEEGDEVSKTNDAKGIELSNDPNDLKTKENKTSVDESAPEQVASTLDEKPEVSPKKASLDLSTKGPLFWEDCTWRSKLCRCQDCLAMYKSKDCEYLLDDRDTIQYYEAQGRELAKNRDSPYERGMTALNRMNRAAVVEALNGYDELKADLSSYLRKFADTKKVVREEDIHDFFAQLKTKKRQRLEYE